MRGVRPLHVFVLSMTAGCSTFQGFPDRRPPTLPAAIVEQTSERYRALVERLTLGL